MSDLAMKFERQVLDDSKEYTKLTGTSPSRFLQMVAEVGGVETARVLALSNHPAEGFTRAWEHKCMNLTVEHTIVYGHDGEFQRLFTDDVVKAARKRLRQYGINGRLD